MVSLTAAPLASADGDPASDVLYSSNLFPSYDGGMSPGALKALRRTINDSRKAGYEIRVAVIARPDDLGAVNSLWEKPKAYALFLGTELGFVYHGPVLIVMPNGIGFYADKRNPQAAYAALKQIRTTGTGDALAKAAIDAVSTLATKAGHAFAAQTIPTPTSDSGARRQVVIATIVALLAVAAVAAALAIKRRRRQ